LYRLLRPIERTVYHLEQMDAFVEGIGRAVHPNEGANEHNEEGVGILLYHGLGLDRSRSHSRLVLRGNGPGPRRETDFWRIQRAASF
jgi:hypothetical protein